MEKLCDAYYLWLCDLAGLDPPQGPSYITLGRLLHRVEYYSILGNDDNRGADGKNLRFFFSKTQGLPQKDVIEGLDRPCSVLEMMLGLSVKISEWLTGEIFDGQKDDIVRAWFWVMVSNLGLDQCDDYAFQNVGEEDFAYEIVRTFLDRKYDAKGNGSLFPLRFEGKDTRYLEIWAQFNEYLKENPDLIL